MIGFFFKGKDKRHLIQMELEFVLQLLGAAAPYTGRGIREAHAPHPIMGGQFNRRTQILRETMRDHELPEQVQRRWLEHTESLRSLVTPNEAGECRPRSHDAEGPRQA
jgi:truncated hemoglobin YjbI